MNPHLASEKMEALGTVVMQLARGLGLKPGSLLPVPTLS